MQNISLDLLGWRSDLQAALDRLDPSGALTPARVATVDRGGVTLWGPRGLEAGLIAGRLSDTLELERDALTVGDWVAVRDAGAPLVTDLLPRRGLLARRALGGARHQPIAAHLDAAFIVTAVGRELNPRRLERYLVALWDAGITPVIVVNKTDLPHDRAALEATLRDVSAGAAVVWLSALHSDGVEALAPWLGPGQTVACVGSSGVGKSTLTNALLQRAAQDTQAIRDADAKGRHTTTRRELFALDSGALLIDTPGMREFGVASDGEGLEHAFEDVVRWDGRCRFRDCAHEGEPGCAIQEAIERGELSAARLRAYQKLLREQAHFQRRQDTGAARDEKRRWKQIHLAARGQRDLHRRLGLKE